MSALCCTSLKKQSSVLDIDRDAPRPSLSRARRDLVLRMFDPNGSSNLLRLRLLSLRLVAYLPALKGAFTNGY